VTKTQKIIRHGLLALLFLLGFLALSLPRVIFITRIGFAAWYPPIGLVVALLLGISPWYGLLVVVAELLSSDLIYHQSLLSYQGLVGAGGSAICYCAGAYVLRTRLTIDQELGRRRDVLRYLFVMAVAAAGSTLTGVTCLLADRNIRMPEFWSSLATWVIGDGIGVVGIAPFLLIHVFPWVRRKLQPKELEAAVPPIQQTIRIQTLFEVIAQILTMALTTWIMFDPRFGDHKYFLGLVPVVWIAMRLGTRGAAAATLALNIGLMVAMHIFPPDPSQVRTVGLLMLLVSSVGLLVGASVTERDRISRDLSERTSYLDSVIANSPFGLVVLDAGGRVEFVNQAFEQLTLCSKDELAGNSLDSLFSAEVRSDMPDEWCARAVAGDTIHHTFTWSRKDGSVVEMQMDAVPLSVKGRLRGAYIIYKDISSEIRAMEAERKHTESLNQLVCELEMRTSQMALLNELASLLECCNTLSEAGEATSQCLRKLFPEAVTGPFFMSEKSSWMAGIVANWGAWDPRRADQFALQDCWALRRGRAHWSADGQGLVCRHLNPGANHVLCLPIAGKEGSSGILQLEFEREEGWMASAGPRTREQGQESLGITVAAQLEHSIASLKLREALRDQSVRDSLTGLYNRRFMEESLERELMRASRNGQQLSLLFIDLDHFKLFNDTFGHDAGDFVLRIIGNVFRDFFRGNDLICRFGGEEFAICLPECSPQDAATRADALRARVRATPLKYQDKTLTPVTLSIGVAGFPEGGSTVAELLKAADERLYRSKSSGRDATTGIQRLVSQNMHTPGEVISPTR
jgi:diguanylate cyclase (GGDEF)-like protein/PAS domain S-box-containing protein